MKSEQKRKSFAFYAFSKSQKWKMSNRLKANLDQENLEKEVDLYENL